MKRTYKRIFDNTEKLQTMLTLRDSGWSFVALSVRFNCDHSSIIYQCQKHKSQLKGKVTMKTKQYLKTLKPKDKYSNIISEGVCQGHDYAHYLEKENEKKDKRTT